MQPVEFEVLDHVDQEQSHQRIAAQGIDENQASVRAVHGALPGSSSVASRKERRLPVQVAVDARPLEVELEVVLLAGAHTDFAQVAGTVAVRGQRQPGALEQVRHDLPGGCAGPDGRWR